MTKVFLHRQALVSWKTMKQMSKQKENTEKEITAKM